MHKYLKILTFLTITTFYSVVIFYGFAHFVFNNYWTFPALMTLAPFYMSTPLLGAISTKLIYKEKLKDLKLAPRINHYFYLAWLTPLFLVLLTIPFSILLSPDSTFGFTTELAISRMAPFVSEWDLSQLSYSPMFTSLSFWSVIFSGLLGGILVSSLLALGEEGAWRGFLFPELLNHHKFWKSSYIAGFIWGLWHTPLILIGYNYPIHHYWGILFMAIACSLMSPIMSYYVLKSKSSFTAALFHGSFNGLISLSYLYLNQGSDLLVGFFGLAGILALILANIALKLFIRYRDPLFKVKYEE